MGKEIEVIDATRKKEHTRMIRDENDNRVYVRRVRREGSITNFEIVYLGHTVSIPKRFIGAVIDVLEDMKDGELIEVNRDVPKGYRYGLNEILKEIKEEGKFEGKLRPGQALILKIEDGYATVACNKDGEIRFEKTRM